MSSQYLFGDTDIAASRLKVLGRVFAESSRAFLRETVTAPPRLALDLGCGPGYSTHFLADVLQRDQVAGLDNSEHFISLAQKTKRDRISFHLHDVTTVPFPTDLSDLLYCRFLLTHVREPQALVDNWATQLRLNGLLLIEEAEWIRTEHAVFSAYLAIVEAMFAHQSHTLYAGPVVDGLKDTDALKRRASRIRRVQVSTANAATMFFLNMQAWKTRPFVRANYSQAMIDQLEKDLNALTQKSSRDAEIEWGMRQMAFGRV